MSSISLRQELAAIVQELQAPFTAAEHSIRKLPGSDLYIYLKWGVIRDRLLSVAPDHQLDYTIPVIDLHTNRCQCKATITILGIAKSALGDVPVSEKSSEGKETTRGTASDRAMAEAFKNTAEAWGVGSYLDDQYHAYKIMSDGKAYISEDYRNKLNLIAEQLKSKLKRGETHSPYYVLLKGAQPVTEVASISSPVKPVVQPSKVKPLPTTKPLQDTIIQSEAIAKSLPLQPETTPVLYPQHNTIIKDARVRLGFDTQWIKAYFEEAWGELRPDRMTPDEIGEVLEDLAIAKYSDRYQNKESCRSAYQGKVKIFGSHHQGFLAFCDSSDSLAVLTGVGTDNK